MDPKNQMPQGTNPKKPGSNMTLVIILIIVGALIVLGVGGFLVLKYYFKTKFGVNKNITTNSGKLSLKALEETFQYPNGTITKTDHTGGMGGQASDVSIETPDKIQVVYDYYINLATVKKLTVSRKTIDTDKTKGSITLQGKGYYADIYLNQNDPDTEIDFSIFGDNITDDTL